MNANETPPSPGRTRRWFRRIAVTLALLIGLLVVLGALAHESRPVTGATGEAADALARRIETATGQSGWQDARIARWTFADTNHYRWDRQGHRVQVRWDDVEVLLYEGRPEGVAFQGDRRLHGEEARDLLQTAHERFINDSFWLNPFGKFFDEGVTRSVVSVDGEDALLIEFASGGVTPGDAYLISHRNGQPTQWKMWVSILPIGGVACSWSDWRELAGGARASTRHSFDGLPMELVLRDVSLSSELEDPDLFGRLP